MVVPQIRSAADVEESLTYWHCREIRLAAIENFAAFNYLNTENVAHDDVLQSSAGVLGWAFSDVRTWSSFVPPVPPVTIDNVGSCSSIAHEPVKDKVAVARRIFAKTVQIGRATLFRSDGVHSAVGGGVYAGFIGDAVDTTVHFVGTTFADHVLDATAGGGGGSAFGAGAQELFDTRDPRTLNSC